MKRGVLYLVIGIPAASIVMGIVVLYLAFSNADPGIDLDQPPLSKSSWRESS